MSDTTIARLDLLREAMRKQNVGAVIIPGTDPHQSEYVADHWKFRDWLTGFTGSNGTVAVTLEHAALWTDSRYFLQAEQQLNGTGIDLVKEGVDGEPTIEQWLVENLEEDDIVAVDGRLFSAMQANRLEIFCGENAFMFAPNFYPADVIWPDRPPRPLTPVTVHDESFAGESVADKVSRTIEAVERLGGTGMLITALDEIAWLYNLRGDDVEFTPVTIAFAYVSARDCSLFIDAEKISSEVKDYLRENNIRVRAYDDVERFLERRDESDVVILDPNRVSDALAQCVMCGKLYSPSPIALLKAVKNDVQLAGIRRAMERDGAALVRLFMWLEQAAASGTINEIDVWERAKQERAKGEHYRGDSFSMIVGYKEHGAIVHYSATPESASTLQGDGLLLLDSGAQYLDGTTDITRTITLGNVTDEEKHDFTLVLKGHLALAAAQFPTGTCGVQLDALARLPLWREGLAYFHGTGHGVGHFLGCHEGPHSIRTDLNATPLQPGMVTSNEPGLYRAGKYGIRTENLLLVVEGDKTDEFGNFLRFETLTLFPYDTRLIDCSMLTKQEIKQVNDYHALVLERLTPQLNPEEVAWLTEKCKAL